MQNTNNELVSVIVPVYKVEPYLDRCVASILAQTYPNLEVILVDDGSPDNCPALCDAWAQRDARIRVIHKKNGGLSDARNVGLDAASGAYISFVDSDDYIAENFIETLYDLLHEYHTDISAVHWKLVYADAPEVPAPPSSRNVTLFKVLMPSGSFLRRIPTHVMHGINYANGNCLTPSGFRSVVLWKILALHTRSCSTQADRVLGRTPVLLLSARWQHSPYRLYKVLSGQACDGHRALSVS